MMRTNDPFGPHQIFDGTSEVGPLPIKDPGTRPPVRSMWMLVRTEIAMDNHTCLRGAWHRIC